MEIFKYRHLALGLGAFLVSLYISYYMSNLFRILVLSVAVLSFLILAIIFIIKKQKSTLDIFIRCAFLCVFVALAMAVSLFSFQRESKIVKYCDGNEHEIFAEVQEVQYETEYESGYIVKIKEIDGKEYGARSLLVSCQTGLKIGDTFEASASIRRLENDFGVSERSYYLDDGIFTSASIEEYTIKSFGSGKMGIFKRINEVLSSRFYKYLNEESASLFSSLLLGNDHLLDASVRRDFSRIGISHVLALSGMHITILTMLIGLILKLFKVHYFFKNIILISFTGFFVALTGFSGSAVRAGIMVCIFYLISMIGYSVDTITTLFLSVSIICLFSPYSIFSVSLALSFLAMLGCLVGFRFARSLKLSIKFSILRYLLYSLITSMFVVGFTLPVIFLVFGNLSILSPLTNLIIAPIFTGLIYFAPFLLATLGIPYLTIAIKSLAEYLTSLTLTIVKWIANLEGIVIPTFTLVQFIAMVLIVSSLILLMLINKKRMWVAFVSVLVGSLVFFGGSVASFVDRYNNVYVSVSSYKTSDFIFLESKNDLTVVDISTTTTGIYTESSSCVSYLHYTEIENYIICDYSHLTDKYFSKLAKKYKIKNLYLPSPVSEKEEEVYNEISKIAKDEKIELKNLEKSLHVSEFELELSPIDTLDRSDRRSIALSVKANGCELLYLGSSSYEIFDYFTEEKAKTADIVFFGSYGPTYKVPYYYSMPYLDKAIFTESSYEWADDELTEESRGKIISSTHEPIRFKLKD